MLKWFADRMPVAREMRDDERGFTLIELLVVVIIIGILAAIAIPTFLSQRDNADDAAAESDLRNLAASASAFGADNDGRYTGIDIPTLRNDYNWNQSDSTDNPAVATKTIDSTDDGYTAEIESATGTVFEFDSADGTISEASATTP